MGLTEDEVERLRERCRALPPAKGNYLEDDFLTNVVVTVVDFMMHTRAVERAMHHFITQVRPGLTDLDDLERIVRGYEDGQEGNTALAEYLWGYRLWTRAHMLRDLIAFFQDASVTTQDELRAWAAKASFVTDFEGKVRGLGPAVFNWLVMRQGVETVKPDVHVLRFAERAIGRRAGDQDVVRALTGIAVDLGVKAYELDWAIWESTVAVIAGQLWPRTRTFVVASKAIGNSMPSASPAPRGNTQRGAPVSISAFVVVSRSCRRRLT